MGRIANTDTHGPPPPCPLRDRVADVLRRVRGATMDMDLSGDHWGAWHDAFVAQGVVNALRSMDRDELAAILGRDDLGPGQARAAGPGGGGGA